jgi:hypothetical protein
MPERLGKKITVSLAGLDEDAVASSQEAVPVPYLAGEGVCAAKWISPLYNPFAREVRDGNKKSAKAGGTGQYNYYGSIAALVALGPVDALAAVEVNSTINWRGELERTAADNPAVIDVPDLGTCRFYWGGSAADGQAGTDPLLTAGANGLGHAHSAYAGFCYAVFEDALLGKAATSAPNIRFYVRRAPRQSLVTGAPAALVDNQANPVATIADLLSMFDGYLRQNAAGLLELGIHTPIAAIDPGALPLITADHLTDRPSLTPRAWDDVPTRWRCTFNNRALQGDDPRHLKTIECGEVRRLMPAAYIRSVDRPRGIDNKGGPSHRYKEVIITPR